MPALRTVEQRHQLAFAERQFQQWIRRVDLANLKAQVALAKGDHAGAAKALESAQNWLEHVDDCNASIDSLRRELEPAPLRVGTAGEP